MERNGNPFYHGLLARRRINLARLNFNQGTRSSSRRRSHAYAAWNRTYERLNYPTLGSSPHQVEPRQARRTEVAVHPDGHFCLYACYQRASSFPEQILVAPRSVGIATSSAILIVAAYSFFTRLAQDYVETLTTTTFVTSALLAVSARKASLDSATSFERNRAFPSFSSRPILTSR